MDFDIAAYLTTLVGDVIVFIVVFVAFLFLFRR